MQSVITYEIFKEPRGTPGHFKEIERMNIIEVNSKTKELFQARKVAITFNMVQLMYAWTFHERMPKDLAFVDAYRKVLNRWDKDCGMVDLLIANSKRIAGNFETFKKEINKFKEVAK